ncbi:MAG: Zn-ribbon containing protein [Nanoarchaeota archaeon]|nr:Zn-ribbon containing protein [Nanoarchaeota archaeon]
MPHQCVRCNRFYEDGANEILKGCKCGAKLFFFVKKEQVEAAKEISTNLSKKEKQQIENDVYDIIGQDKRKEDAPVVLDLESIRILKPGKFEIDLVHLFQKGQPLVYKLEEGKYMIDIVTSLKKLFDKKDDEF